MTGKLQKIFVAALAVAGLIGSGVVSAGQKKVDLPEDHRSWDHVRSTVIHDRNNPLFGFLSIYANAEALKSLKGDAPYSEGSTFVGIFHDVVDNGGIMTQGKRLKYVVMTKGSQFESTGGWGFEAFDAEGKTALTQDARAECYQCHTQVSSTDYVFSKFVK